MLGFKTVVGQVPNNSFETWNSMSGYSTPANWDNLNQITFSSGIFTCSQGTPGNPGSSYLFLMSKTVPGRGVVPGIAVSGKLDTNTYKPLSGYSFTNRPQSLNYNIQYMPYDPTDSTSVKVLLTKWNTSTMLRDTIAYGASYYNAMAHSWFVGSTYLNYQSGDAPDSALIILSSSSSSPKNGSYIYLDNLLFTGSVIGINEQSINQEDVLIYPNPTVELLIVELKNNISEVEITVSDILGKQVFCTSSSNSVTVNTMTWARGAYFIKISRNNKSSINKKIIIQ
ncbi:MAG: T9SS type A sorting domain-containing protein [Bacteroidia bacterium]